MLSARSSAVRASFDHLQDLKCGNKYTAGPPNGTGFGLTPYGEELLIALNP